MPTRRFCTSSLLAPTIVAALFALFPMIARAETNGEAVYDPAVPTIKSNPTEKAPEPKVPAKRHSDHSTTKPPATQTNRSAAPTTGEETSHRTAAKPKVEPESEERGKADEALPAKADNHPSGGDGRTMDRTSHGAPASDGGGGSSPVMPILIAVALLAAASIGFVLYRERKSQAGTANT